MAATTWGSLLSRARWLAREHDAHTAAVTPAKWEALLRGLWPMVWARWPQACWTGGTMLADQPDLPASPLAEATEIALNVHWVEPVAAGLAAYAMEGIEPGADEEADARRVRREYIDRLKSRFWFGLRIGGE